MAIRLDAQTDYVQRTANLPSSTSFTLCGWVRRRGAGGTNQLLAAMGDGAGGNAIAVYAGLAGTFEWQVYSSGSGSIVSTGVASTQDAWYFVALSGAGTGASDAKVRVAAVGANALTTAQTTGDSFTPTNIAFGVEHADYWPNVALAGWKLYNRVLTDAELLAEMNRLRPASTTNLNAWWPMVADVAATADNDYSGNARDLTAGGTLTVEDGPPVGWGAPILVVGAAASGTTYTLDAGSGSYTLTGSAADLLLTRKINAEAGSYALTGSDATLVRRIALNAESGSYAVTGADATLWGTRRINAEAGSYTLTGSDASLLATRRLNAEPGAYAITGVDAALSRRLSLNAEAGSYTLTGADATLQATRRLDAEAGSYTLTGADAELVKTGSYALDAQAGSYTVSGADASMLVTRKLNAEAGSYNLSGADAGLAVSRLLNAEAGNYIITGADAELARAGVYALNAESGSYGITGFDAGFVAPSGGGGGIDPDEPRYAFTDWQRVKWKKKRKKAEKERARELVAEIEEEKRREPEDPIHARLIAEKITQLEAELAAQFDEVAALVAEHTERQAREEREHKRRQRNRRAIEAFLSTI